MTDHTTPTASNWSKKTGLLAFVAIVSVAIVGMGSYFAWNTHVEAQASARKSSKKKVTKPRWSDLTPIQREALAPLSNEWDQISTAGKKKWLVMGDRIALMQPEEKQRAQQRLRDWVKLTPEQRKVARANYALAKKKLPANEKIAQWERYQQLSEEQRKELAATAVPSKSQVVNPPAVSERNTQMARSVKSTSREELQKSVLPPGAEPATPPAPAKPPATSEAAPV